MTFGAVFASILAVLAASDEPVAAAAELAAPAAPAEVVPAPDMAAAPAPPAELAAPAPPAEVISAPEIAAPPANALADAARVAIAAAEAGTPIIVAPAAPAEDAGAEVAAPAEADAAAQQDLSPAPPGPPLSSAAPVLLERVEEPDGWATERLIEPSGEIVVHTVNAAGTVQVCNPVGSLLSLALVSQRPAPGGEYVHVARDTSGALVTYAIGTDGEPRAVRLLAPAPR